MSRISLSRYNPDPEQAINVSCSVILLKVMNHLDLPQDLQYFSHDKLKILRKFTGCTISQNTTSNYLLSIHVKTDLLLFNVNNKYTYFFFILK